MNKIITIAACLTATVLLHTQTTIFVTPNGNGNGSSWATACNLETAIAVAERSRASTPLSDRVQIWVQKGTYYPTKMLIVPDSVKIYGGFSGTENNLSQRNFVANPTIVDGQQKIGSIFRLENAAEINGFTIQNGNANGNPQKNGGGIWADENCVIENCIITNNTAIFNGGGIYATGKVKIVNSTIQENTAKGSGNNIFGNCTNIVSSPIVHSLNATFDCNDGMFDFGEISFKSSNIWKISTNGISQEWSDVVMATNCNKTTYNGGSTGNLLVDCKANTNRSVYGDLFSWCAVMRFAQMLCPAPWRVPTIADFGNLDKAFGGNGDGSGPGTTAVDSWGRYYVNATVRDKYNNTWGGLYGGNNSANWQGKLAEYWTQSEYSTYQGFRLEYSNDGVIRPQGFEHKALGFMLRCVR